LGSAVPEFSPRAPVSPNGIAPPTADRIGLFVWGFRCSRYQLRSVAKKVLTSALDAGMLLV
jgi:hypothetical protein